MNDQDWRLVYHDWPLMNARYNRLSAELYPPDEARRGHKEYVVPPTSKDISGLLD